MDAEFPPKSLEDALKLRWDDREETAARLREVAQWIKNAPASPILLIGPGGVGKTTLAGILAGQYDFSINPPGKYEESLNIETVQFSPDGGTSSVFVIPPGQSHRLKAEWRSIEQQIESGVYRGIIQIGSFGFHSIGSSVQSHGMYMPSETKPEREAISEFIQTFCEKSRQEEISVLQRLAQSILTCRSQLWFLSLVTKEDLWYPGRDSVERHYRHLEYGEIVRQMVESQHPNDFRHEFAFASLVIGNFQDIRGTVLKANTAGYDQSFQSNSLRRLIEKVVALKEWEARQ